jgi:two-component system sensor histidine kinase FlrB
MLTHAIPRPTAGDTGPTSNLTRDGQVGAALASLRRSAEHRKLEGQVQRLTEQLRQSGESRQRELAEKECVAARMRNLLEALPGGVIVLDGDGRVGEFNPAAAELLAGLHRGASWSELVAFNVTPQWDDGHDVTLRSGRRVNISTQALSHEPGQILLVKDVTETRRLQEGLHLYKRLSANTEVAAALAHQLRTPLAVALLDAAQLAQDSDPRTRAGATRVRDALRRLERLIEDVLLFTRGGALGASPTSSDQLLAALRDAVEEMRLPETFAVTIGGGAPSVPLLVNCDAILSGLLNLVHNAAQACAGRGQLRVDCRLDGTMLYLGFADTGPGVNPEDAERIFEPFVTKRAGGTGMGLAVARSVARAHGGDLALSRVAQCGALFELRLPLLETDPRRQTEVSEVQA